MVRVRVGEGEGEGEGWTLRIATVLGLRGVSMTALKGRAWWGLR